VKIDLNEAGLVKATFIDAKVLSRPIVVGINPGPWDLRDMWRRAYMRGFPEPTKFRFMVDHDQSIYTWAGGVGIHRFVAKSLNKSLYDFVAFGAFEVDAADPRKLIKLEYVSKNAFLETTEGMARKNFYRVAKKLRWKRGPGFSDA